MTRLLVTAILLGQLTAVLTAYLVNSQGRQPVLEQRAGSGTAEAVITAEAWPICSSMGLLEESADWAALDPDFAAGKRAMAGGDWNGAIKALTSAGLRDDRNADIQNYLGYAYRHLGQLDAAMQHYQQALILNPRHRGAHEHLGETNLMQGDRAKAEMHLAALEQICLIPCEEYEGLKQAIAWYNKVARR